MNILYHYSHCPFCVRVRLALAYLNVPFKTVLVSYDDEQTPTKLIGKKMLPVLVKDDGKAMPESLDIIAHFDQNNLLQTKQIRENLNFKDFESFLNAIGKMVHNLAMPHWIYTKEFTPSARAYFQKKKEASKGPFKDLIKNRAQFEDGLKPLLTELEYKLKPFCEGEKLSLYDIMIASHLWGLYVVPEFQFSPKIHAYLQQIKHMCGFNYQQDLWR